MHFRQILSLCLKIADFRVFRPCGGHNSSVCLLQSPCWFPLGLALFTHHVSMFDYNFFGEGSLARVQYPKCSYGPYIATDFKNAVLILAEVSFLYFNNFLSFIISF